jgi:mannose-1-phosphate guanylyltransferase
MLAACRNAVIGAARTDSFVQLGAAYAACPADSIDYAVMEKTARAAVVALDAGWSDVGSWASLHDALAKDASGNAASGEVFLEGCRDTYVSANHRLVAAVGLSGVAVVETEDAVLVVAREHAEAVKRVAELVGKRRQRE